MDTDTDTDTDTFIQQQTTYIWVYIKIIHDNNYYVYVQFVSEVTHSTRLSTCDTSVIVYYVVRRTAGQVEDIQSYIYVAGLGLKVETSPNNI